MELADLDYERDKRKEWIYLFLDYMLLCLVFSFVIAFLVFLFLKMICRVGGK